MRPAGEISRAVRSAWDDAINRATAPVRATSRDVVGWLVPKGVGRTAALNTVKNMARAGHLRPVGTVRVPDSARPLVAYEPAWHGTPRAADACADLALITRTWAG